MTGSDSRPRVALLATTWFAKSHAELIGSRILNGYTWNGRHTDSRIALAGVYLEQIGDHSQGYHRPDTGRETLRAHGVPIHPTIAETLSGGRGPLDVDGVLIVCEQGDYEFNARGQKLYPRRRFFDSTVSTMLASDAVVPVFNDKHLSWSTPDAVAMHSTARRLGIPLLAGSSVPLAWRIPTDAHWPRNEPMQAAVAIGYGPEEIYGFHNLEALQSLVERRSPVERGVRAVTALRGPAAAAAITDGTVDRDLFALSLDRLQPTPEQARSIRSAPQSVYLVEYIDGLRAAVVNGEGAVRGWSVGARGESAVVAYELRLEEETHSHFTLLLRQMEELVLTRRPPFPVERTVLTGAVLDSAMTSLARGGVRIKSPSMAVEYRPADIIPGSAARSPYPII